MIYQAYTEMLQSAKIKERETVTQRLLKKRYRKEKETTKKTHAIEYKKNVDKQENLENTQAKNQKRP